MIPRLNRFHGYNSLRFAYQHGKTVRGPMCAMRFVQNDRRDTYRLAVVVSKKVSKLAVVRNRIRRRIFETMRQNHIELPYDIVITVFSDQMAELPQDQLKEMLASQLRQAGIVTKNKKPDHLS